jgi:hypothetical protein
MHKDSWTRWTCLSALLLLTSETAHAAKTDLVQLRNGDRFTCEVKSLDRGRLRVATDDAGTIDIEWDKVVRITAAGTFEVETSDGRRYVSALASPTDGRLSVAGPGGTTTHDFMAIVRITPIRQSFFHRIDGSLDLGFSFVKSSGVTQFTVNTEATYRQPAFELEVTLSSYFTHQKSGEDSDRSSARLGYARLLSRRWEIGGLALIERNPDLGFDVRTTGAGLFGRRIVQTNRATFTVAGGVAVSREQPLTGGATTNVDGVALVDGSFFTYDTPKTDVSYTFLAFPGLSQPGRIRLEPSITARRELFHDFTLAVSAYDSYDNRPPTAGVSRNDVGVTLSVGWTF